MWSGEWRKELVDRRAEHQLLASGCWFHCWADGMERKEASANFRNFLSALWPNASSLSHHTRNLTHGLDARILVSNTLLHQREWVCLWRAAASEFYSSRGNSQNGPGTSCCQTIKTHSKMPGVVLKLLQNLKKGFPGWDWQFRHQK